MTLTTAKARRLLDSQNSIATHVYNSVPLAEAWSTTDVIGELARSGRRTDKRVVESVLHQMASDGLIQMAGGKGSYTWRKVAVKAPAKAKAKAADPEPEEPAMTAAESLLQIAEDLTDYVQRAKAMAEEGAEIASRVEAAAADVESELAAMTTDTERLRQLKSLLRDI